MGRRGEKRSDISPPAIRPTDSAAVIAPHAAGPPRWLRATAGPSTMNPPYQAIRMMQYCATIVHSQVRERNSDQPSRNSRHRSRPADRSPSAALRLSSTGTVPSMPTPHMASAHPGPMAATTSPATAAPAIWPAFIASRLSALACVSSSPGTSRGSSACEAG